jgi:hypothetical protein
MTKTTLKALWVGGGGVVATWLAVAPNQSAPPSGIPVSNPSIAGQPSADTLNAQVEKLRFRTGAPALGPSTRNPFHFDGPNVTEREERSGDAAAPTSTPAGIPAPLAPPLTLSGIAERNTPDGLQRTAVITADGQIYLDKEGESDVGLYTVVKIDSEAVVLRDLNGADLNLVLR